MPDDAPRLLIVAHATPRPVTDGPDGRLWRFVSELAGRSRLKLLTVIDQPINQADWRHIHGVVPDTTLVRRGRIGRYARLPRALDDAVDQEPFHLTLLSAPSLLSMRYALPACPVAVDLSDRADRSFTSRSSQSIPDIALVENADDHEHLLRQMPEERVIAGDPASAATRLIRGLYADAQTAARSPATARPARRAA